MYPGNFNQTLDIRIPKLLVIDDLFGRGVPAGRNEDRENLCAHFLLQDVTGDTVARSSRQKVLKPIAEAVFCRGQSPASAQVGDIVENDLRSALEVVRSGWNAPSGFGSFSSDFRPWSLVLLDLCFYTGRVTSESHRRTPWMPEGRFGDDDPQSYFGLILLEVIHREFPEIPIFIFSSKPREEVSLEFSRRGALGFIARDDPRGPELMEEVLWQHGLLPDPAGEIVGHSVPLMMALREARRAARHRENLLIRGDRGTGKELLARYVNQASREIFSIDQEIIPPTPFVPVNSAMFTSGLFASELFGIQPHTATGVTGKIGLIESANGGDLFLDEIADMPIEVQAALLRVLQERKLTRIGDRRAKDIDVRFLSATNADLDDNEACDFRPDLLDRLQIGGTLWLPPLRERPLDIPLLVEKFVREAEAKRKGALHREIAPEVLEALSVNNWLGNIRELRSVIFDVVNRYPDVEHLVIGQLRIHSRVGKDGAKRSWQHKIIDERERQPSRGNAKNSAANNASRSERETEPKAQTTELGAHPRATLNELLAAMKTFTFEPDAAGRWSGRLHEVQMTCAWLLARYLEVCLELTKRRTPEAPSGVIQIHPAVKLVTGNPKITASKAADTIKRLLSPLSEELTGDLREAYEIAIRLRPKSTNSLSPKQSLPSTNQRNA
jgi:DNA-binding NtrC family response regulator